MNQLSINRKESEKQVIGKREVRPSVDKASERETVQDAFTFFENSKEIKLDEPFD